MTLRVLILTNSRLARDVLHDLCDQFDYERVDPGGPNGGPWPLSALPPSDVVVVDTSLDGDLLEQSIRTLAAGGGRVLALCDGIAPERGLGLLSAGALGYLTHDVSAVELAAALRLVSTGVVVVPADTARLALAGTQRMEAGRPAVGLTVREHQVLEAMAEGLATKAIAQRFGLAVKTVENHKTRLFRKLGARTNTHAVALGRSTGLIGTVTGRAG